MNSTNFASKKLKGRDVSAAPLINNYNNSGSTKEAQKCRTLLPICEADAPLFLSAVYNKKYTSEKITSRCPQSGRSMIEMLGVLAIIGVLSVGGIAGYSKAMMKYRTNKTIEQITLIANSISTFYKNSFKDVSCVPSSTGNQPGCTILKKAKLIPDEMIEVSENKITKMTNPFSGNVGLVRDSSLPAPGYFPGYAYSLVYEGISPEACIDIATHDWSNLKSAGLVGVSSGDNSGFTISGVGFEFVLMLLTSSSSSARNGFAHTQKNNLSLTLEEAIKGCTCSNDVCNIAFGFYR